MTELSKDRTYTDAEVKERLQRELPHWYLEGAWIRRKYRTHGWKGTLMVINTVGHLAEAAWHHPDITASYAWVEVRLQTHTAKGITGKDFALAKKIEEVVHWQPGKEGGALEGTGLIDGDVQSAGVLAPGFSAGQIDVDGDLGLLSGSELRVEVAGLAPGTGHDFVAVSGNAALAGALSVSFLSGFGSAISAGDVATGWSAPRFATSSGFSGATLRNFQSRPWRSAT